MNLLKYLLFKTDINANDIVRYSVCVEYVRSTPKGYTKILIADKSCGLEYFAYSYKNF